MATNSATFVSQQVPSSINLLYVHAPVPVSVTMFNSGDTVWVPPNLSPNPYRLGSQNPQDNTLWGLNRVDLTRPVSPGDYYTFNFSIDASLIEPPPVKTPKYYNFQWRMVQEGIAWFGDFTPNVAIKVWDPNV